MCGPSQISTTPTHFQLVRLTSFYLSNVPQPVPTLSRTPSLHSWLTKNMFQERLQDGPDSKALIDRLANRTNPLDMNPSQESQKSSSGVAKTPPKACFPQSPRPSSGEPSTKAIKVSAGSQEAPNAKSRPSPKTVGLSPGTAAEYMSVVAKAAAEPEVLQSKVQNTVPVSKSGGRAKPAAKAPDSPSQSAFRLAGYPGLVSRRPRGCPSKSGRTLFKPPFPKVPKHWSKQLDIFEPVPEPKPPPPGSTSLDSPRRNIPIPVPALVRPPPESTASCSSYSNLGSLVPAQSQVPLAMEAALASPEPSAETGQGRVALVPLDTEAVPALPGPFETGQGSVALPIVDACHMQAEHDAVASSPGSVPGMKFKRRKKKAGVQASCNSLLYYDIMILEDIGVYQHDPARMFI